MEKRRKYRGGQIIPLEQPNSYAHLATKGIDRTPLFSIMGSVMGWVVPDATATVSSRYVHMNPFGQVLNQDPNWPAPFGFAGYWYEGNSNCIF